MSTAFVFSAQGTQWPGMGRDLLRSSGTFSAAIDACDASFAPWAGWSVRAELETDPAAQRHHVDPARAQPTLTALQIAIAATVRAAGTEPDATAGLSMGEAAAAWCAGMLDVAQTMRIAWAVARLAEDAAVTGAMAFLRADDDETARLLTAGTGGAWRAVELGGDTTVIAGTRSSVGAVLEAARRSDAPCAPIALPQPYHTPLVDPLRDRFLADIAAVDPRPAILACSSSVARRRICAEQADAAHWWRVCREPASWPATAAALLDDGVQRFVEIGPHPMLFTALRDAARERRIDIELQPAMERP